MLPYAGRHAHLLRLLLLVAAIKGSKLIHLAPHHRGFARRGGADAKSEW